MDIKNRLIMAIFLASFLLLMAFNGKANTSEETSYKGPLTTKESISDIQKDSTFEEDSIETEQVKSFEEDFVETEQLESPVDDPPVYEESLEEDIPL